MDSRDVEDAWYEEPRHHKKAKKKRFKIESKYTGYNWLFKSKWSVWSKYSDERARDKALAALNRTQGSWKYRAA